MACCGELISTGTPLPAHGAGGMRVAAEQRLDELAAACADQAVQPDDLAAPYVDRDALEALAGEAVRRNQLRADRHGILVIDLLDRAGDHTADQPGLIGLGHQLGADQRAVTEDRDTVGQLEHLLQTVADIHQRHALRLQPADQRKELRRFLPGQVGGRLIKDQEARAAQRRAGCGDELLLADGQRGQHHIGRNGEAEVVQHALRLALHAPLAQDAPARVLVAQEQVGRNRQMPAQDDLLMHCVDAERDGVLRAGQADGATFP